jgi:hypothetical protein
MSAHELTITLWALASLAKLDAAAAQSEGGGGTQSAGGGNGGDGEGGGVTLSVGGGQWSSLWTEHVVVEALVVCAGEAVERLEPQELCMVR